MAIELTAVEPLWAACDTWLRRAEEVITASAEALNTLNVFPVSDADTGSNLRLTLRGIAAAVPSFDRDSLDSVARSAVLSAHGSSGAILAEMVTSLCQTLGGPPAAEVAPGAMVALLLRRAATAATKAVARPIVGTILTVAEAAATAAESAASLEPDDALAVATEAQARARAALLDTPAQLDVLARAGVVDAGGQAYVLLLDVLVETLGGALARPLTEVTPPHAVAGLAHPAAPVVGEYEVMYAIRGARRGARDALRAKLSVLGHSVVVVGDRSVAQVHVHLKEPGAAVEAGLALGRLSQVRITALEPARLQRHRTVLSLVAGDGLADTVHELGGVPLDASGPAPAVDALTAALTQSCDDVVILPNDMEHLEVARHLEFSTVVERLRAEGRRVAVIPTVAQVQGLAALAVHEPTSDFDSAVVAMSTAAAHTRQGAVTVAEGPAMTMAGRCRPGDVLGVVEGDFVEVGDCAVEVGERVAERLLATGGELVTIVRGADADAGLVSELRSRISAAHEGVAVETLDGGQRRYLVLIGVE